VIIVYKADTQNVFGPFGYDKNDDGTITLFTQEQLQLIQAKPKDQQAAFALTLATA
jgi:hypothetical protein